MATFKQSKMASAAKVDGQYIFQDFSNGLYMLETPRGLGEQLGSLSLVGGRNVWAERSALVSQYGYQVVGKIPEGERVIAVSDDGENSSSFFIVTYKSTPIEGTDKQETAILCYLYTASQGLKRYKTILPDTEEEPMVCRRGNDLIIIVDKKNPYMFGGWYSDSDLETVILNNVTLTNSNPYYKFTTNEEMSDYFWNGKQLSVKTGNDSAKVVVSDMSKNGDTGDVTISLTITDSSGTISAGKPATIVEKTIRSFSMVYKPEDTSIPERTINPELISLCVNRLFVVDSTGDIYYSKVGNIDSFEEKGGAGYFGDFYNDTSKVLALEDYMGGCLITKQTGFYHVTIGDSVTIKKVTQVGQQYASDHVIVGDEVYCYDSNTGQLVRAAYQNVFGSMVAGAPIITSEYLGSRTLGIDSSKRFLTYNAENSILILYYGEQLNRGVLLTSVGALFPRELDKPMSHYLGFNQGVAGICTDGTIVQDFKRGTIIPNLSAIAEFEAIGLRSNRMICSSILEVTELNDITFNVSTYNADFSTQKITPSDSLTVDRDYLPPMLYSDYNQKIINNTYSVQSKWVDKRSGLTRVYAPMSGRGGISITLEFNPNETFCLVALRLPDFSQGE